MSALYSSLVVCVIAVATFNGVAAQTGLGIATRGWDCCKPSCSWRENTAGLLLGPVQSCNALGRPSASIEELSGCQPGGTSFACPNQQPFPSIVNPLLSYATAGANIPGVPPQDACCSCYRLTFLNSPFLLQKELVVQITNDRGNLDEGQFNIHVPGAGVGLNVLGCPAMFGGPLGPFSALRRRAACGLLPTVLTNGCDWMFGWYGNVINPEIEYTRVQCPAILVAKTGCRRADDALFPRFSPAPGL